MEILVNKIDVIIAKLDKIYEVVNHAPPKDKKLKKALSKIFSELDLYDLLD